MVAIKNVALISTLAAMVMAAPAASPASADVAARDTTELTDSEIQAIVSSTYGLEKRDLFSTVSTVLSLVGGIVDFLGQTLNNVATLNLSGESDALANLLGSVNAEVLKLVSAIGDVGSLGGLGGFLQQALLNTAIAGVILPLASTVSTIVSKVISSGGVLSDVEKTAFSTLQATLGSLLNILQSKGLGAGALGNLQGVIGQLGSVL